MKERLLLLFITSLFNIVQAGPCRLPQNQILVEDTVLTQFKKFENQQKKVLS